MTIIKICLFAIVCAIAVLLTREQNKEIAVLLVVAGGIAIAICVIEEGTKLLVTLQSLIESLGISVFQIKILFKVIGIGYLAQLTTDVLEDMNVKSLADKVALTAKILILAQSLPILSELFSMIGRLL